MPTLSDMLVPSHMPTLVWHGMHQSTLSPGRLQPHCFAKTAAPQVWRSAKGYTDLSDVKLQLKLCIVSNWVMDCFRASHAGKACCDIPFPLSESGLDSVSAKTIDQTAQKHFGPVKAG